MNANDSLDGLHALEGLGRPHRRGNGQTEALPPLSGYATGPLPAFRDRYASRPGRQFITVSVAALRTFALLSFVVAVSVVLSVVATISLISVLTTGVIQPQYSRYNQPTQVTQLGICVSRHGRISTPTQIDTCHNGRFVHVQPAISHP